MIRVQNEHLKAAVDPFGAELKSLRYKGREYLWQGNAASWSGQSPQLFPVIGACPEEGWTWNGETIHLGNHGFARKTEFEVLRESDTECVFRLEDTPATRKQYPFPFRLDIGYRLEGPSLHVSYAVDNPGEGPLLFSLGAHPGFNCPLEEGLSFEDYELQFNQNETIQRRYKEDFLTGEREEILMDSRKISLDYSLFERGAIILSGLQSDSVVLSSEKGDASVRMDFAGFPDFGIWTIQGKNAPYVCLEPWFGVDSTVGDSRDFEDKEGLVKLEAGKQFRCRYTLTLN